MCRWITFLSAKRMTLSDVVLTPSNSLVQLSRDASFHPGYDNINNAVMNGDGFGIGWYHSNWAILPDPTALASHDGSRSLVPGSISGASIASTPDTSRHSNGMANGHSSMLNHSPPEEYRGAALYKDVYPAWNNENLREICMSTASDCFMAHVRAASPKTGISIQNCHPFKAGRLLFCHNGRIPDFSRFRRRVLEQLTDEAYLHIRGTTDSEVAFALVLTFLSKDGHGSPLTQTKPFGAKRLVSAIKKAIRQIELTVQQSGLYEPHEYATCNYSITDGETMVVTRYCDRSPDVPPPSLYFAYGDAESLHHELTSQADVPLFATSKATPSRHASDIDASSHGSTKGMDNADTASVSSSDSEFEESQVILESAESRPGKVMEDVDPETAAFIVASNPLTKTHLWHKLPQNSIMWCTRGSHPELRLLRHKKNTMSLGEFLL
jgi:predicted glutamine amidotransferase